VSVAEALQVCTDCKQQRPAAEFVGARGWPLRTCSACRENSSRTRASIVLGAPPRVITVHDLEAERRAGRRVHLQLVHEFEAERPKTRGDCASVPRPCPWVSCPYSLYLDVDPITGSIKLNHPDKEPDEIDPDRSCALDIADLGGASLEDVGLAMNMTRERVRQIEEGAMAKVRSRSRRRHFVVESMLREYTDATDFRRQRRTPSRSRRREIEREPVAEVPREADEPPERVSFFARGERADERVREAVWNMLKRREKSRGFDTTEEE